VADPRTQPDEPTPLVDVPSVPHKRGFGAATMPEFGNVPVPAGAAFTPPAPPSAPRPPSERGTSSVSRISLSSVAPPHTEDDEMEKTRVGATIAGAPAYRPSLAGLVKRAYLTVMAGARAGEMFKLVADETILGRGPQSGVHLDSDGVSRRHARIVRQGEAWVVEDLGSTNGTWIDDQRVGARRLADGDRIQIGTEVIVRFHFLDDLEAQLQQQLYESAVRDPLTRAYNRKHFQERLRSEIAHALRHRGNLSLILLDVDRFKSINDTLGHPAGDAVLRALASAIGRAIRVEDVFARIGGEEFALLARGIDGKNAVVFAERLRRGIERLPIPWGTSQIAVTSSFGVATLTELWSGSDPPQSLDGDVLVARADQRLYAAKSAGRNRVVGP
jgi:diguanylate cyclase (GGDEF)-like protein